jgi:SAM-dependent methyltransferase
MEKKQTSFQDTATANYKKHTNCRVCNSDKLTMYLDLGELPLPNNLELTTTQAKGKQRFPLQVMFCENCALSQLSVVVDPQAMFSYYTYRSSINGGYVRHCRNMAIQMKSKYDLTKDSLHIDIAGNDGALLKQFKEEIGLNVINIDPAKNLCAIAESEGIRSYPEFLACDFAEFVIKQHGECDLITATNVFAHVDNVKDFMQSCKILMKEDGILVLEFPYIVDFIEGFEMDTVYHEHLSYFSIVPLMRLCSEFNMKIFSVEKFDIHGGTVRVSITNEDSERMIEASVSEFVGKEIDGDFCEVDKYLDWAFKSHEIIRDFGDNIRALNAEGKKVAAFAASAKGNTLMNCAKLTNEDIRVIIDETPEKIGHYSPGTGIQIKGVKFLEEYQPDYLVILSWNFADEIMKKIRPVYKGKFIIPIPEFKIID